MLTFAFDKSRLQPSTPGVWMSLRCRTNEQQLFMAAGGAAVYCKQL